MRGGASGVVRVLVVGLVALCGCLDARSAQCSDGRICGPGTVCAVALDLCVDPSQIDACRGLLDGAECPGGRCNTGVCLDVTACGNSSTETGEMCDDGNTVSGDGCSADCKSDETCGNGVTDLIVNEQCDCGVGVHRNPDCQGPNDDNSGICNTNCTLRCGDGIVAVDEVCDPQDRSMPFGAAVSCVGVDFDRGLTTCSSSCQPLPSATCKYIGWRTLAKLATNPPLPIQRIALTSSARGFYLSAGFVDAFIDFTPTNTRNDAADPPLAGLWATNNNTAIAVGAQGTIRFRNGSIWSSAVSGTNVDLRDVWGRDTLTAGQPDDVYAIGDSTVIHFDGTSWSSVGTPPAGAFRAVAGDTNRVYVAGDGGKLVVHDGASWQTVTTGTSANLHSVWAVDGFAVAVGDGGTILQNTGSGFVRGKTSTTANLLAVWGTPNQGFFAAGERGTLVFYDGAVWRPMAFGRGVVGSPTQTLFSGFSLPDGEGGAGPRIGVIGNGGATGEILTYEGAAWSPTTVPTNETIHGLWGSAPDDVFAVGRNGTIVHYNGLTWTRQLSLTTRDLHSVIGVAPNDVYAVGDDLTLLHYNGTTWTSLHSGPATGITGDFVSVLANGTQDLVIASTVGIFHWDGSQLFRQLDIAEHAVWEGAAGTFAAGAGIRKFDGTAWNVEPNTSGTVLAIAGSGSDIYAVGPTSFQYHGATWSAGPFKDPGLKAVYALPNGSVFAAGDDGALRLFVNGLAVEPMLSRASTELDAIFVIGKLVFMAGVDGTLEIMIFHE